MRTGVGEHLGGDEGDGRRLRLPVTRSSAGSSFDSGRTRMRCLRLPCGYDPPARHEGDWHGVDTTTSSVAVEDEDEELFGDVAVVGAVVVVFTYKAGGGGGGEKWTT